MNFSMVYNVANKHPMNPHEIPFRLNLWPIFSYIEWPEDHMKVPERRDWLYLKEIPEDICANLSIGRLKEFLENEVRNPNFVLHRDEAVWIREYLWKQEKHFRNKDWRKAFGEFYEMIFQA